MRLRCSPATHVRHAARRILTVNTYIGSMPVDGLVVAVAVVIRAALLRRGRSIHTFTRFSVWYNGRLRTTVAMALWFTVVP